MTLPNYFLADLPPDASLSAAMITEACQALKRNRERYLAARPTESVVRLLSSVAASWLEPDNPFRRLALEQGPAATGFSGPTLAAGLEAWFKQITSDNLNALLEQDLGHGRRLDEMIAAGTEPATNRAAVAVAPEMLVHIAAGNLPIPAFSSMTLGVLLRSAQFVKCATGSAFLPRLYAHSLYDADRKLGACLELAEWPGGKHDLETALFAEADCVTATGTDETLETIRRSVPPGTGFAGYGHRVSFGFIAAGVLSGLNAGKVASRAAADVTAWDQVGCLSPHTFYVEHGGATSVEQFAEKLAAELARREEVEPRGRVSVDAAAAIASRRSLYEVRAADSPATKLWSSQGSSAWTVVYEADPRFQLSCLNRFIYVKGVTGLSEVLQGADHLRRKVSTVGLAAPEDKAQALATELARWGATRVCPLGQMQRPPLAWRHDGRPALGELVRWTDWEM